MAMKWVSLPIEVLRVLNNKPEIAIYGYVYSALHKKDAGYYVVLTDQMLGEMGLKQRIAYRGFQILKELNLIRVEVKQNAKTRLKERRVYLIETVVSEDPIMQSVAECNMQQSAESKLQQNTPIMQPIAESKLQPIAECSFTKEVDLKEVENRSREAHADSEPSPSKKSQPKHVDYPQTVEAVKEMVVHYRDTHPKVEDIENLDVDYYAQAIFDYYVAPFNDGKWRDKHNILIKVPSRAVGGWINRDVEKKSLKVKDPYEGMTYDDLMASLDTVSPAEKERRAREGMVDADFEVVTDEPFPQIPGRFSL